MANHSKFSFFSNMAKGMLVKNSEEEPDNAGLKIYNGTIYVTNTNPWLLVSKSSLLRTFGLK